MTTWLRSQASLPEGGEQLAVTYCTGNQSSANHLALLNPVLSPILGCVERVLFRGSLNLWADEPTPLPSPWRVRLADGNDWLFVPVVIQEKAVGVAARRGDSGDIRFIEVFACEELVPLLGLTVGDRFTIRLLPGDLLC